MFALLVVFLLGVSSAPVKDDGDLPIHRPIPPIAAGAAARPSKGAATKLDYSCFYTGSLL
jgi:hypothetical protein